MRKYIRNIIRSMAKKENVKPSRHVKVVYDQLQKDKYGEERRKRNQARGTHKAKGWSFREAILSSR